MGALFSSCKSDEAVEQSKPSPGGGGGQEQQQQSTTISSGGAVPTSSSSTPYQQPQAPPQRDTRSAPIMDYGPSGKPAEAPEVVVNAAKEEVQQSAPVVAKYDDKPTNGGKTQPENGSSATTTSATAGASNNNNNKAAKIIKNAKFTDAYRIGEELGVGAFSRVKEGSHKKTGSSYAIKIVTKSQLTDEDEAALKDEIAVLGSLHHPNIIRLYEVYDEPDYYYLVTEKMMGGELFDRIVQKSYYNEKEARDVCVVLFRAIQYCHQQQVVHRDLKPENLLLLANDNDSNMKIADFGFAKRCTRPNSLTTQCGTPGYVAPEILEGNPYDTQVDMWSLGVIVYILLGGYPPFIEQDQRELFRKIRRGQYEFHEEYWGQISSEAKNLIRSLLNTRPLHRVTADLALQDPWVTGDDDVLSRQDLSVNLAELLKFNAKRKVRGAINLVMAANKLQSLGVIEKS